LVVVLLVVGTIMLLRVVLVVVRLMFGLGRVLRRRRVVWLTGLWLLLVAAVGRVLRRRIRRRRSVVATVGRTRMVRVLRGARWGFVRICLPVVLVGRRLLVVLVGMVMGRPVLVRAPMVVWVLVVLVVVLGRTSPVVAVVVLVITVVVVVARAVTGPVVVVVADRVTTRPRTFPVPSLAPATSAPAPSQSRMLRRRSS
jgi:hypothetical protein